MIRSCRWTCMVALVVVGLLLGNQRPMASASSLEGRVNMQRLKHVKEALADLQVLVGDLEADMEKQMSASGETSRQPRWHPAGGRRHPIYDTHVSQYEIEAAVPEGQGEVSKKSWTTASGNMDGNLDDRDDDSYYYGKRNLLGGFSAARGKRRSSVDDVSYKRGPPQGFSSVRGKRYGFSDLSDKRSPPGGFSSVRGKRQFRFNPFSRLVEIDDADEPPKRGPPMGFSSVRGKRVSAERVPRQDYYRYMVSRILSGH